MMSQQITRQLCSPPPARYYLLAATFCLLFCLLPGAVSASGLTLYSYVDDLGQTIVVDSLERIPEQYRANAKRGFIPSFRSPPPPPARAAVIEAVPDAPLHEKPSEQRSDRLQVSAPPDEVVVDVGLASATLAMEQLRLIHLNNERIFVTAQSYGMQHPSVNHLHLTNGQLLVDFRLPEKMSSEPGKVWLTNAGNLFEQLKAFQFNVSRWITENPQEMLTTMPLLLTRVKILLTDLEASFTAITPATAE